MKTWTFDDKTEWGDGPWQDEPDKAVWIDEASDFDCMIHRNRLGALCGYVGVGPDHPWHGADYDHIDADIHGGLTFANSCNPEATEDEGICHVPEPGRPHDVWWVGFDCIHAGDTAPVMALQERRIGLTPGSYRRHDTYKTFAYVKAETARLAEQAARAATKQGETNE